MLKIFNHLKINYRIRVLKVRIGLEGVQPRTANEQILESNQNLVRLSLQSNKGLEPGHPPLPEVEIQISNLDNLKMSKF